jgi:transcriptional regulator with XRE-family HTH domain
MQHNDIQKMKDRLTKVIVFFHGSGKGTKQVFCQRIGIHHSMLSNWLNGNHEPASGYRDKICAAYGVRRAWLDSGAGEMLEKPLSSPEGHNFEPQKLLDEIRELKARLDEVRRAFDILSDKCGQGSRHEKNPDFADRASH